MAGTTAIKSTARGSPSVITDDITLDMAFSTNSMEIKFRTMITG